MPKKKKQVSNENGCSMQDHAQTIISTIQDNSVDRQSILDQFAIIDDPITMDLMETHCAVLKRCGAGSHSNQEKWLAEYGHLWQLHFNRLMECV